MSISRQDEPVHICSVAPIEFRSRQVHSAPILDEDGNLQYNPDGFLKMTHRIEYVIPAAERGSYSVLPILHAGQQMMDTTMTGDSRPGYMFRAIWALDIAKSLVSKRTDNSLGSESGYGPGLGLIENPEPTTQELASLNHRQESWCRWLVTKADNDWIQGRRNLIGGTARSAAHYLGLDKSPEHEWVRSIKPDEYKSCFVCQERIRSASRSCPNCGDLIQYAVTYAVPAKELREADPFLAELVAKRRQQLAASKNVQDDLADENMRLSLENESFIARIAEIEKKITAMTAGA